MAQIKESEAMTYDKFVQFVAPLAWIILGLLGWSLDRQIAEFQNKISAVDAAVSTVAGSQAAMVTDIAEIKVRQQDGTTKLSDLSTVTRERGNQIERMSVQVGELLESRREERKSQLDRMYNNSQKERQP